MMKDTETAFLLTFNSLKSQIPSSFTGKIILLDEAIDVSNTAENLNLDIQPENLIYTIYTSGSTGKPERKTLPYPITSR